MNSCLWRLVAMLLMTHSIRWDSAVQTWHVHSHRSTNRNKRSAVCAQLCWSMSRIHCRTMFFQLCYKINHEKEQCDRQFFFHRELDPHRDSSENYGWLQSLWEWFFQTMLTKVVVFLRTAPASLSMARQRLSGNWWCAHTMQKHPLAC